MKIDGPYTLYLDANFKTLTDIITLYDAKRWSTNGTVHVDGIDNSHSAITMPVILGWHAAGGSVTDYPFYIKMSTATYAGNVPDGMPNRSYTDEDDNEVIRTWAEWKDATHNHFDADDGDKMVPANSWGVELTSTEMTLLNGLTGYELLTSAEFTSNLPDPE